MADIPSNDLVLYQSGQLPETIEEKAQLVLYGPDALKKYRANLSAYGKRFGKDSVQYKQLLWESQETSANLLRYSVDVGEHIAELPKATKGNQYTGKMVDDRKGDNQTKSEAIAELGFTQKQARDLQTIAANPDTVEEVIENAKENDDIPSKTAVLRKVEAKKKEKKVKKPVLDTTAEEIPEGHKRCNKCRKILPTDQFYKKLNSLEYICKDCKKRMKAEYRDKHRFTDFPEDFHPDTPVVVTDDLVIESFKVTFNQAFELIKSTYVSRQNSMTEEVINAVAAISKEFMDSMKTLIEKGASA